MIGILIGLVIFMFAVQDNTPAPVTRAVVIEEDDEDDYEDYGYQQENDDE